jgi:hypothetical protein
MSIALFIFVSFYGICGLLFAVPFVLVGVNRIDPHAGHSSWGFRLLIIPGTVALWPLLLRRWWKGFHESPEEVTPHRSAVQKASPP